MSANRRIGHLTVASDLKTAASPWFLCEPATTAKGPRPSISRKSVRSAASFFPPETFGDGSRYAQQPSTIDTRNI